MEVSIVGGSPSTEHDHPQEGEVWVHGNQLNRHLDCHITRVFEIHNDLEKHGPDYPEWLVEQSVKKDAKLIVGEDFPIKAGNIQIYPYEKVKAILPLLTSTPAYMMGMAVLEGAAKINIFGVDMSVDDFEYFYQRPAMYAWIAYAKAKGIEVYIPEKSLLFNDSHVEGREERKGTPPFTEKDFLNMAQIHIDIMDDIEAKIEKMRMIYNTHHGTRQAYERLAKVARSVEGGQAIPDLVSTARVLKGEI